MKLNKKAILFFRPWLVGGVIRGLIPKKIGRHIIVDQLTVWADEINQEKG